MNSGATRGTKDNTKGEECWVGSSMQRFAARPEEFTKRTHRSVSSRTPVACDGSADPQEVKMQNEAKNVLNDFHPHPILFLCASLPPFASFVALQFQQMQYFAARNEEMQNEAKCQNGRCDKAPDSRPRSRRVLAAFRCASDRHEDVAATRGRSTFRSDLGVIRCSALRRNAALCSAFRSMQNEPNAAQPTTWTTTVKAPLHGTRRSNPIKRLRDMPYMR
jgi:hypothetical protein